MFFRTSPNHSGPHLCVPLSSKVLTKHSCLNGRHLSSMPGVHDLCFTAHDTSLAHRPNSEVASPPIRRQADARPLGADRTTDAGSAPCARQSPPACQCCTRRPGLLLIESHHKDAPVQHLAAADSAAPWADQPARKSPSWPANPAVPASSDRGPRCAPAGRGPQS